MYTRQDHATCFGVSFQISFCKSRRGFSSLYPHGPVSSHYTWPFAAFYRDSDHVVPFFRGRVHSTRVPTTSFAYVLGMRASSSGGRPSSHALDCGEAGPNTWQSRTPYPYWASLTGEGSNPQGVGVCLNALVST